jgi:vacuolar-type H+-ATPase subunit I/STV1
LSADNKDAAANTAQLHSQLFNSRIQLQSLKQQLLSTQQELLSVRSSNLKDSAQHHSTQQQASDMQQQLQELTAQLQQEKKEKGLLLEKLQHILKINAGLQQQLQAARAQQVGHERLGACMVDCGWLLPHSWHPAKRTHASV